LPLPSPRRDRRRRRRRRSWSARAGPPCQHTDVALGRPSRHRAPSQSGPATYEVQKLSHAHDLARLASAVQGRVSRRALASRPRPAANGTQGATAPTRNRPPVRPTGGAPNPRPAMGSPEGCRELIGVGPRCTGDHRVPRQNDNVAMLQGAAACLQRGERMSLADATGGPTGTTALIGVSGG